MLCKSHVPSSANMSQSVYILFNLVLMKGAGLTTQEAEALYLSTEQIHHGRQQCKLPHTAPNNVPHLCPGGTTSRGERIDQSPWPIQTLAFLLRLTTKLPPVMEHLGNHRPGIASRSLISLKLFGIDRFHSGLKVMIEHWLNNDDLISIFDFT